MANGWLDDLEHFFYNAIHALKKVCHRSLSVNDWWHVL